MLILEFLRQPWCTAHLLKLFDKMCKYEMDTASIVKDTERTWFSLQTDGQMDRRTKWNPYSPLNFIGGVNSFASFSFHIRLTIPEIQLFQILTLKNSRSRSWVRSKVTQFTHYLFDQFSFHFTWIAPTVPEIWTHSEMHWSLLPMSDNRWCCCHAIFQGH